MKKIFLLSFFTFLSLLSFAQIVGGGGFCAVAGNPNSFAVLNVVDSRFSCTNVKDTVTGNIYTYIVSNALGSRWVLIDNYKVYPSVNIPNLNTALKSNLSTLYPIYGTYPTNFPPNAYSYGALNTVNVGSMTYQTYYPHYADAMRWRTAWDGIWQPWRTILDSASYENIIGGTYWKTKGNSGTVAGTNFLGTTDTQDLVFKINNTERLKLTTTGDNIFINTLYPAIGLLKSGIGTWYMGGDGSSSTNWALRLNANSPFFIVNSAGNVGINTTTPAYKFDVNGDASATRLRYTQNVQYASPIGASGSATDASVLVRDKTTGFIGETNLMPLVAWNNGNTGPLSIGTKDNNSLTFITNNTTAATISTAGDLVLSNKLNLPTSTAYHAITAADWGWSNMLMRNQTTGNIETTTTYDIVKGVGLLQTDTVIAWPSRNVVLGGLAHDVFINGRIGTQNSTDSIVFNLPASPVYGQEINFYVQKNAKLWTMDIILDCGATNGILFDEGNGLATNFAANKTRKCFEFGASANNTAYTGDLLPVNTGKSFKITCNYNHLDKLWTVTNVINQ
jgi:hypothetical protein